VLKIVQADLHVHTCLSPCADLDMTPMQIVKEARKQGLALIAITDHNSAENVAAVRTAATRDRTSPDPVVIAGMEVTSVEEAHMVVLFATPEQALDMQEIVYERLLPGKNDEERFGLQVVASPFDEVDGINDRLLIGATSMSVDEVVATAHRIGGMAFAAHIDRESFSLLIQLGFIPPGLALDAVEVSPRIPLDEAPARFADCAEYPFVTASDAHRLENLGASPLSLRIEVEEDGTIRKPFEELRLALRGQEGREILPTAPGA
jgi:PHP family Zn ribbon phosphoesterase